MTAATSIRLADVAHVIVGKVECLGGNVYGAVAHAVVNGVRREIVVTEEDGSWLVTRCDDPDGNDAEHDHTLHDGSIGPVDGDEVPTAVDQLLSAARLTAAVPR